MDKNIISFPGLGIDRIEISPIAFRIPLANGGSWPVAWYGIIITTGFILAFLYAYYRAKKERFNTDHLVDYLLYGMIFGVIGARCYYVLTKLDTFVVKGDIGKTLYNIVAVWGGGLAIYGGIIAGALTVFVLSRIKKQSFFQVADLVIPGVALAQSIGRWGNFINAEAHGGVTELPWRMGIKTPQMLEMLYVHPTFLYESLWNLSGFLILHFLVLPRRRYFGQVFLSYVAWYGFGRMLIEGLRTDSLYIPGTQIRISQLVALLSCLVAVCLLIYFFVRGRRSTELDTICAQAGQVIAHEEPNAVEQGTMITADGETTTPCHEDEQEDHHEDH